MTIRDLNKGMIEPCGLSSENASGEPSPRQTVSGIMLLVYWILLFLGTHLPSIDVGGDAPHQDKYLHLTAFTVLAVLLCWFVLGMKPMTAKNCIFLLTILVGYGAFDELTQFEVTGRTTDVWDFGADILGSISGIFVYLVVTTGVRHMVPKQIRPS